MRDGEIWKNHKNDKEVGVKARHSKMKGIPFASKINYHYNILLKKVAGSLALGFLKFVVFLENLPLWSMCSWASVGGPGQNPCIILEVRPDPWFPIARYSSLKGSLKCCGRWSLFPAHPFCKATPLILGTNTVLQDDGKKRGAGCVPMGGIPPIWLYPKVKVWKSSSHAVRPRRASERWERRESLRGWVNYILCFVLPSSPKPTAPDIWERMETQIWAAGSGERQASSW